MKRRDFLRISLTIPAITLVPSLANTKPTETLHEQMLDAVQKTFVEPRKTVLDIEILGHPVVQNAPIEWESTTGYVPALDNFEYEVTDFICEDDIFFKIYEAGESKVLLASFNPQLMRGVQASKCLQPTDTIRFAQNISMSIS